MDMMSICAAYFCQAFMMDLGYTEKAVKYKLDVCVEVSESAFDHGVDQALAVAVAHVESAFSRSARSSAGAVGPMQVIPKFWCDGSGCDHTDAGIRALRTYVSKHGTDDGLCAYFSGSKCRTSKSRIRYRDKVLSFYRKSTKIWANDCIAGC